MLPAFDSLSDMDTETRALLVSEAWSAYKQDGDPCLVTAAYEILGSTMATELYGAELVGKCLALTSNSGNPRMRLH